VGSTLRSDFSYTGRAPRRGVSRTEDADGRPVGRGDTATQRAALERTRRCTESLRGRARLGTPPRASGTCRVGGLRGFLVGGACRNRASLVANDWKFDDVPGSLDRCGVDTWFG
jgi:hypothetical protein